MNNFILFSIALIGTITLPMASSAIARTEKATFAGGCFWCMEKPFEQVDGVISVISGYTGGAEINPTYKEVSAGRTGHAEAVEITFNPDKVSYNQLLDIFWRQIDPTDPGGQFADRGPQYRTGIFTHSEDQKQQAEASKSQMNAWGVFQKPIVTEITDAGPFYPAENYHQDYYQRNPIRYKYYRYGSGRDKFLETTWMTPPPKQAQATGSPSPWESFQKPDTKTLKKSLSELSFRVTQKDATERPFQNQYWDNKAPGIYVDIVSGEPLFSSTDKFKSGTGWPSFTKPLVPEHIVEKVDKSLWATRTEVRSRYADSHLGHVFTDGPAPTGLRYCLNSASLRFIPAEKLSQEGYGRFEDLFK